MLINLTPRNFLVNRPILPIRIPDPEDSDQSLEDYPMDRQKIVCFGAKLLLQMADVADQLFDFCEDSTLFALSMTCTRVKHHLTSENTTDRAIKKGYLVRILKFKYSEAANRLKSIQRHLLLQQLHTPKVQEADPVHDQLLAQQIAQLKRTQQLEAVEERKEILLDTVQQLYKCTPPIKPRVVQGSTIFESEPAQADLRQPTEVDTEYFESLNRFKERQKINQQREQHQYLEYEQSISRGLLGLIDRHVIDKPQVFSNYMGQQLSRIDRGFKRHILGDFSMPNERINIEYPAPIDQFLANLPYSILYKVSTPLAHSEPIRQLRQSIEDRFIPSEDQQLLHFCEQIINERIHEQIRYEFDYKKPKTKFKFDVEKSPSSLTPVNLLPQVADVSGSQVQERIIEINRLRDLALSLQERRKDPYQNQNEITKIQIQINKRFQQIKRESLQVVAHSAPHIGKPFPKTLDLKQQRPKDMTEGKDLFSMPHMQTFGKHDRRVDSDLQTRDQVKRPSFLQSLLPWFRK